jgi:subtilisin family serine protease
MLKKKKLILSLAVFFFFGALIIASGPKRRAIMGKTNDPKPYAKGEVLVKFKKGFDLAAVSNFAQAQSLKVKKRFKVLSQAKGQEYALLSSPEGVDSLILANTMKESPQVEFASPNYRRELCATPNDTNFSSLWGMHNTGQTGGTADADIDAPEAWNVSTGSTNVIVAVIDTGFDYTHPDLAANAWINPGEIPGNNRDDDGNGYIDDVYGIDTAGTSGTTPDVDPMDGYGHGTHCAGTIGAVGNNSLGVAGVNWNVRIMGLKFMDDAGENGYDAFAIECMEYAVWERQYHGQNIVAINASWGSTGGTDSGVLRDAIEVVIDAGIVFCAAAGNGGTDGVGDNNDTTPHYPSSYTLAGLIAVAATDHNDALGSFSNYGAVSVDLGAPGVSIVSTLPPYYTPRSGDIFFDNVENGAGSWTHGAISGTDHWAITTNQEAFANASFPVPSPPNFWSDYPGANYPNNSNTWLAYNANINLSGYAGQEIYFGFGAAWYILASDHGYVEFSSNGGSTWTIVVDFTNAGYYWSSYYLLIPESYKTTQFRMRFRLTSNASGNQYGWLIDNVGIGYENTYYEAWDGTSMACPHVAGAVGLMASVFPNETVAQRKKRILDNGDAKAALSGRSVTGRRLNLYNSITAPSPATDPALRVTSPDGGEVWLRNTVHNITWTSEGTVGNVNLHYSTNNGTSWTLIAGPEANDGVYSWTTPNVAANQTNCLVRVQETDGSPSDQSDAVFSIVISGTETVSIPTTPNGPATGSLGASLTYVTGGSESSLSDPVQYYFNWGDGTNSGWLATGAVMAAHSWSAAGTYNVTARARCATHTAIVSAYSTAFVVRLYNEPTWAGISRFAACAGNGQPTVEWHTAGEAGAVGFNLWRRDRETKEYVPVNSSLLPALTNSPQGGIYSFSDPGAFPGEPVIYRLEEIDALGRTISYGPFTVTFGDPVRQESYDPGARMGKEEPSDIYGYQRFARDRSLYEQERLNMRRQEQQRSAVPAAAAVKDRAKITVKGRGLFYVTAAQIARSLGLTQATVEQLIRGRNLSLTSMGKYISWLADRDGAGLFFYNEGIETVYSNRNIYYLERGSGLAMEEEGSGNAGPADPGQTFKDTLHFEENRIALLLASMAPAGDLWFWDYIVAGAAAKSFAIEAPGSMASGLATLNVALQGATDTAAENDHHAVISLNGSRIGETVWDGAAAHEFAVEFDASLLRDGANTISVSGALDMGAPYSTFYVESFDLSYQRYYKAVANSLLCRGDGNSVVTVSGITEAQAVVLDVSNPPRPKIMRGAAPDVSGRITFVPRSAGKAYLVSGLNAALRPLAVVGDRPAQLKGEGHSAEYIVIAPEEFKATAQQLADYRQGKGLKSLVVTLEDIYDAFNYGLPSPLAIRAFLAQAYKSKTVRKKVKYAVLAGKGTYDYNDYQGQGDNLVPVILGKTPNGLCAADKMFGDVAGKDGLPEIAIGRLPAVTNAELGAMIDKIKAYESGQGAWTGKALFIADNGDGGGDFAQGCNDLATLAVGLKAEKIYHNGDADETRNRINAAWNAGAALVAYCGHAGLNQLAMENIFAVADADVLQNGAQLPLAAMFTCMAGRFEIPGFTSLGEALLLNGSGGAAAGLFPSGAAMNADSLRLGEQFFRALFRNSNTASGAALVAAMKSYLQLGGAAYLLNLYNWIGDPALVAK